MFYYFIWRINSMDNCDGTWISCCCYQSAPYLRQYFVIPSCELNGKLCWWKSMPWDIAKLLISQFRLIPISWTCTPNYRQEGPRYYWYYSSTCFALEYILTQSKESAMVSIIVSGWFTWYRKDLTNITKTTHILYFIFQPLY